MRIISKHKDIYDFMVSKYGYDEVMVLDRTNYCFDNMHKLEDPKNSIYEPQ